MKNTGFRFPNPQCLVLLALSVLPAHAAQDQPAAVPPLLRPAMEAPPEVRSEAALLMDAETGTVLYAKNPGREIPPASLAKLMTMHLVLREAAAGRAGLDEPLEPRRESWAISQPPRSSLMFLAPGQTVTLREILLGLAVPSGNDAAVAAALRFAPTVRDFAEMMNGEARRLGLVKTRFVEPSGISEYNVTTAAEFAAFCREYLRAHPESLAEYHSVTEFAYPTARNVPEAFRERPGTIVQENHNTLLKTFPGVDGLKTGYIDEAGYNIALTAERGGTRFLAVILGAPARPGGEWVRNEDGRRLLSWAFDRFKTIRPAAGPIEPARLWKGRLNRAALVTAESSAFTAPSDRGGSLRVTTALRDPLIAPLEAGTAVGELIISDERGELRRVPLLAAASYERGNIFKRLWHSILLFFRKGRR
ncbi:MAG: D-alanyl-D-alanine carboxypeptidase [Treponema sp.]|nr:D-alanyl-D-alanine carboxypeptidase [Treponema sp.]